MTIALPIQEIAIVTIDGDLLFVPFSSRLGGARGTQGCARQRGHGESPKIKKKKKSGAYSIAARISRPAAAAATATLVDVTGGTRHETALGGRAVPLFLGVGVRTFGLDDCIIFVSFFQIWEISSLCPPFFLF